MDRDGVIIENRRDYVKSWKEVSFLPGVFEALRRLSQSDYVLVLVTNQSAAGRGIITLDRAIHINERVVAELEAHGGKIEASYLCPHHPEDRCNCRKPAPGMLFQAAKDLELDLSHSYLVGDAVSDIEAAYRSGMKGILVLTGRGQEQAVLLEMEGKKADYSIVTDLEAAIDYIMEHRESKFCGDDRQ